MPKNPNQKEILLLPLLEKFIRECKQGKRLQKNGKRLTIGSARKYEFLYNYLQAFCNTNNFLLRLIPVTRLSQRDMLREKAYWDKFYLNFTNFLYDDKDCYDNFVGTQVKLIRAFFNYLEEEKSIAVGPFHKRFFARNESIAIIALEPARLNFLIYDQQFKTSLPPHLQNALCIFIFGCTVALRYSDLMALTPANVQLFQGQPYLSTRSIKTGTSTRVKLPQYALDCLPIGKRKTLLPQLSKTNLNKHLKTIGELAGWTEPCPKIREKRGIPIPVFKNNSKKEHFRFCDMLSSHTMRRTAITTMLMLGMNELMVRRISGHGANSKEFFKYVSMVQSYLDQQTDSYFHNLENLSEKA